MSSPTAGNNPVTLVDSRVYLNPGDELRCGFWKLVTGDAVHIDFRATGPLDHFFGPKQTWTQMLDGKKTRTRFGLGEATPSASYRTPVGGIEDYVLVMRNQIWNRAAQVEVVVRLVLGRALAIRQVPARVYPRPISTLRRWQAIPLQSFGSMLSIVALCALAFVIIAADVWAVWALGLGTIPTLIPGTAAAIGLAITHYSRRISPDLGSARLQLPPFP